MNEKMKEKTVSPVSFGHTNPPERSGRQEPGRVPAGPKNPSENNQNNNNNNNNNNNITAKRSTQATSKLGDAEGGQLRAKHTNPTQCNGGGDAMAMGVLHGP